jgi:hypothetical protein
MYVTSPYEDIFTVRNENENVMEPRAARSEEIRPFDKKKTNFLF